jgi:hypothetical protein
VTLARGIETLGRRGISVWETGFGMIALDRTDTTPVGLTVVGAPEGDKAFVSSDPKSTIAIPPAFPGSDRLTRPPSHGKQRRSNGFWVPIMIDSMMGGLTGRPTLQVT